MSRLLLFKVVLYFAIAALTVFVGGAADAQTTRQWVLLSASSILSGIIAVRAFVDRSFASEMGTPTEANPTLALPLLPAGWTQEKERSYLAARAARNGAGLSREQFSKEDGQ